MPQIAFLFPGQGAQHVGMGSDFIDAAPRARQRFDDAAKILGYDLAQLCLQGPAEKLDSTVYSQPALFVTSLAALDVLQMKSPQVVQACAAAAGLSLGEYTALVFADALDFEVGLKLVQERGAAMQEAADATPSGMVSILGLDRERVEALCQESAAGDILQIANLLCPGNVAVSGTKGACRRVAEKAEAAGATKVVSLHVAGAFHTPIMQSAVARLTTVLATVPLKRSRIPVISNVDARPHDNPDEIRQLLTQQIVSPVRWEDSIRHMLSEGYDEFYEVGPGRVLRGLLKRVDRKLAVKGVDG